MGGRDCGDRVMNLRIASLVGAAVLVSACGFRGQDGEAEERVAAFHQFYNEENFDRLYAMAGPEFRRTTTSETFNGLMRTLRDQLGDVERSEMKDWRIDYFPERRITLTYDTEFSRGSATELFRFDYDQPRLIQYSASVSEVRPQ
jgi:hypothetical protein